MSVVKHLSAGTVKQIESKLVSLTKESATETETCLMPDHRTCFGKLLVPENLAACFCWQVLSATGHFQKEETFLQFNVI